MTTEMGNSIRCCNQPMRYDRINDGAILNDQRLTGTYYCERCSTMRPTYESVGNTEHNERLRKLSKSMSYSCWTGTHTECEKADRACEHHETQPAPDTSEEWRVQAMPTHGWRVVDATEQEIVADVYREEDARQIVSDHNAVPSLVAALNDLIEYTAGLRLIPESQNIYPSDGGQLDAARAALAAVSREGERDEQY
jgi:hypothetical protein